MSAGHGTSAGKRVCVIGAGPSGITAAKNLLDEGHRVVVFEADWQVGGNWVFREGESHSSVFETTHIISSKRLSEYEDFPMPREYPDYPSHRQLAAYFQSYAREFGVQEQIRFGARVERCEPLADGGWNVRVRMRERPVGREVASDVKTAGGVGPGGGVGPAGSDDHVVEERFDALAVCNGHHWKPRMPEYPGEFTGRLVHSHGVKRFAMFEGERVLVIGGGNSACDVAVESARVSAGTDISWRRGYWVVPKFVLGQPSDMVGRVVTEWLPTRVSRHLTGALVRLLQGSNKEYGLPEPEQPFGFHHPVLNSELLYSIRHGKITPRPDVERFDGRRVQFTDGTSTEYDTVVACTGYWISHPFFDPALIDYSKGEVPLYLRMLHPELRSLYFIGLFQPLGCIWPGAELQSRIMARELAGRWRRPANVAELAVREVRRPDYRQIDTPRHTITVDYHKFRRRLRRALRKGTV